MKFNFSNTSIGRFRIAGITEGVSFLVLLFIAMPLKYFAGIPEAVKVIGWIHGVLFIAYIGTLIDVRTTMRWSLSRVVVAFLAALVPFGTFLTDVRLRKEELLLQENKL